MTAAQALDHGYMWDKVGSRKRTQLRFLTAAQDCMPLDPQDLPKFETELHELEVVMSVAAVKRQTK